MTIVYECGYCGGRLKLQGDRHYLPVCDHYKRTTAMTPVGAYADCDGYRLHVIPATLSG